jgi:RHS repeat-associated protein
MTSVPKPASLASSLSLKWDAWNRLVEAKDGEVVVGVYEYDGLQRRVKRHVDSQAPANPNGIDTYIHYFYNFAWQVLETRDTTTESDQPENLQPDWQYIWSPRYIDAPVLRDRNIDTDGLCDDERIYFLNDANFNVTTLVDTGGDAVERYLYDAYGRATMYDDPWANVLSASSYANIVLYTGRERDVEMELYQYRHRYYEAELGRFVTRDPFQYADRMNLYEYCNGEPLGNVDPNGRRCEIALRCNKAGETMGSGPLGTHCGLVVNYSGRSFSMDGTGGSTSTIYITEPPRTDGAQTGFRSFPDSTCDCLLAAMTAWNKLSVPRDHFCQNSNWTLKCLTKKCNIRLHFANRGILRQPVGFDCQDCLEWRAVPGTAMCYCVKLREHPCPQF